MCKARITVCLILVFACAVLPLLSLEGTRAASSERLGAVDAFVAEEMRANGVPGVSRGSFYPSLCLRFSTWPYSSWSCLPPLILRRS